MTDRPTVTIYTDGGSEPNPGPGGWGALLIAENETEREISGAAAQTTNNRMELTAAIEALRALTQPCTVTLHTDSLYLRNGITRWLPAWIARGWRRKDGQPVQNDDLWRTLNAETQRHTITWQWVKGHAGNEYNERVDRLATTARRALTGDDPAPSAPDPASDFAPEYEIALRVSVAGKACGWAARVVTTTTDAMITHTGRESATTSNRLVLVAAREALHETPPGAAVRVYCPDDYLFRGMTEWVTGWQRRGWRTASGSAVKHQDAWQALVAEADRHHVEWVHEQDAAPDLTRGLASLAATAAKPDG